MLRGEVTVQTSMPAAVNIHSISRFFTLHFIAGLNMQSDYTRSSFPNSFSMLISAGLTVEAEASRYRSP